MELDNYRNFLAIIEAGSFTGAADYVHIAQPALSKQLRALENYFGTKLIITTRGSRQILLTEAGRVLYQKAKYMCALEDLAKSEIENIYHIERGYDDLVGKLRGVGADIRRVIVPDDFSMDTAN